MINLKPDECCGCMACINACPVNAIFISHDNKSNDIVSVDHSKCIGCAKCERVCPVLKPVALNQPKAIYAVSAKDDIILKQASSGGAAYLIACNFIKDGGIVYGCKATSITQVEHIQVNDKNGVKDLLGSKYVKSDINHILPNILKNLKEGKRVLFIGTPCQVAAVINFTGNNENLYTIDLVCHGEPSIKFLERYAHETMGEKLRPDIVIRYRQKSPKIQFGTWFDDINTGKSVISQPFPKSPYMAAFFAGISYRENCHICSYARTERVADLTLGDFWGLKSDKLHEQNGVSLIMCNSEKGKSLFDLIKLVTIYEIHTIEEAIKQNANLSAPFKRPEQKDAFYQLLKDHTIKYAVKRTLPIYRKANNPLYQLYLKIAVALHRYKNRI